MAHQKSTLNHWITNAAIMTFVRGLGLLPYETRSALMGRFMRGWLGRIVKYRRRVETNLNHIYPNMPATDKARIADDTLNNAGRSFIENAYPEGMYQKLDKIELWGAGVEAVLNAKANGQGVVFVSGHFGNHEAFRAALYQHGIKVGGIYRPMANPYFNKHYRKWGDIGGRSGQLFKTDRKGTLAFRKALKNGEQMILLLDIAVHNGKEMMFMGKPAMTSTAAASFALSAGALYVPYFAMRNPDKTSFSIEIAEPIAHSDADTMTQAANTIIEDHIHQDPGNWFWIHRRWKHFI